MEVATQTTKHHTKTKCLEDKVCHFSAVVYDFIGMLEYLLIADMFCSGGKAKPLKQPKKKNQELDEVSDIIRFVR